jgi:DnaJ family protein C protein 27
MSLSFLIKVSLKNIQTMFESVLGAIENGGRPQPIGTQLGYTREQADAIQRLRAAKDNHERLGVTAGASK